MASPQIEAEIALFRDHLRDLDFAPSTIDYYATGLVRLHQLASEALGEDLQSLHDILPRDVMAARDAMLAKGRAASTANWVVFAGRSWGTYIGEGARYQQVRPVQLGWKSLDALSDIEYNRLLRTLDREAQPKPLRNRHDNALRDRALFALTLGAALRLHETLGVQVGHVRLGPQSGWVRVVGKGMKEREAPIPEVFRSMLRDRIDEVYRDYEHLGPESMPEGPERALVLGGLGEAGADKALRRWGRKAGLTISAHMLRRTRGRRWRYKDKVPIENVARWLGHTSIEVTRRYTEDANVGALAAAEGLG